MTIELFAMYSSEFILFRQWLVKILRRPNKKSDLGRSELGYLWCSKFYFK